MKYVDVIVPLAVDSLFTYAVPDFLEEKIQVGGLVWVSFAGNKKYTAVVWRLHDETPQGYQVKPVEGIAEERVRMYTLQLKFLMWIGEYYMAAPGEVMKAALPVAFRLESFTMIVRTVAEIDYADLTPNETAVVNFLKPGESCSLKELEKYLKLKNGMPLVKSLLGKGYVCIKETVDDLFRVKTERTVRWSRRFGEEELGTILDRLKRAPAQHKALCRWIESEQKERPKKAFLEESGCSEAALRGLCEKGILEIFERRMEGDAAVEMETEAENRLSSGQLQALESIRSGFLEKECILLRGVTSSGKTEIYIHLIREYLGKGKQVLYMLPEIALTVQIVRRLQRVFGDRIGIYHSGMSDRARAEMWRKQCSDTPYQLVLGVRSSVFLPFASLGLIIIDEEHDASYKQKEPAPRYQGRDAAIMLGKMYGARVLLGSATPSFESWQNAKRGKYGLVELTSRYGGVALPQILLADVAEFRRKKLMVGSFSPLLIEEMRRVLDDGKQVILFQNRRGYSSYIQCDRCGSIPKCKQCDVSMTYYKQRQVLVCRYCGAIVPVKESCPECGQGHYRVRTPGTEKIEEEVGQLFPQSRIGRMDLDVIHSKTRFRAVIDDFEQGKTNILIGTQMVTKGLDFEQVKLVGVIDADSMIHFPDFRAEERAYCMLMQVGGRSGRREEQGKVIIQTAEPDNRIFHFLRKGDYPSFYEQLAEERRLFGYPPFGRMIQIELRYKEEGVLRQAANLFAGQLRKKLGRRVCGPAVPEVGRIGGIYRLILLLKIEHGQAYSAVKTWIKEQTEELHKDKKYGGVRVFCDVDP